MTWPKEDRIRWVEWRLNEWDSLKSGRREPDPEFERSLPAVKDLEVWLTKERDELSWQQTAIKHFPECTRRSQTAATSMARRAHSRIEEAIAPSGKKFLKQLLDGRIQELFHCTPEEFKKYLRRK